MINKENFAKGQSLVLTLSPDSDEEDIVKVTGVILAVGDESIELDLSTVEDGYSVEIPYSDMLRDDDVE